MKTLNFWLILVFIINLISCADLLEPDVPSEISPGVIISSEDGVNSILNSAYANISISDGGSMQAYNLVPSATSGETIVTGGGLETDARSMFFHNYTSSQRLINDLWVTYFAAIRDANIVIASIEDASFSENFSKQKTAEEKFIRGLAYSELLKNFGTTPIPTHPEDIVMPRASLAEMKALIENDLQSAASILPVNQSEFGRATRGASLAALAKYHLNSREWQEAADFSQQVIDLNRYLLITDYSDVFAIDNEGNDEMIWVHCDRQITML